MRSKRLSTLFAISIVTSILLVGFTTLAGFSLAGPTQGESSDLSSSERSDEEILEQRVREEFAAITAKKDTTPRAKVEEARLAYWMGYYAAKDEDKLKAFEKGANLMESEMSTTHDPEVVLLWAANAGRIASLRRDLASLKLITKMEERLLDLANRHSAFESGAAHRALASLYMSAPPLISVGSGKKAARQAELAYKVDATHPGNILILAQTKLDAGDEKDAQGLFAEVLRLATPERYRYDFAAWRAEARAGLRKTGET